MTITITRDDQDTIVKKLKKLKPGDFSPPMYAVVLNPKMTPMTDFIEVAWGQEMIHFAIRKSGCPNQIWFFHEPCMGESLVGYELHPKVHCGPEDYVNINMHWSSESITDWKTGK